MLLLLILRFQQYAGGTDGKHGAYGEDEAFARLDFHIIDEGSRVAVGILQGVDEMTLLVTGHKDGAVPKVHTGVVGLDGGVDGIAFLIASDTVFTHLKWQYLFVMEHILDDHKATAVLSA